jgi:uncharacterized protein YkwD
MQKLQERPRRPVAQIVLVSSMVIVALAQCRTAEVVQQQPTPTRSRAVAGESGETSGLHLPLIMRSDNDGAGAYPPPDVDEQPPEPAASPETALFDAINAQRAQAGCQPLSASDSLAQAALDHSRDMAERNFFSHTGSDGSKPAARASRAGYEFLGGFETITAGQKTADEALQSWLNSKPHRDILLNCTLDDAGLGFVHDTDGDGFTYYWTGMFGSR